MCRWHHPSGRKWRGTEEPLDESERGEWKSWLKLNIQKIKIMASGPNISLQIDGGKMETVANFIFLGSKTIADGDCRHEIKRCLLPRRKAMTNLDRIVKKTDITLPTKACLVNTMVFPVVMYWGKIWSKNKLNTEELMLMNCVDGGDSWESLGLQRDHTIQSWRKSVLNIHWNDWCWSWNSNTLTTWCEELTHWKRPWCWERLKAGGEGDDRGWDGWMASLTQCLWVWASSGR